MRLAPPRIPWGALAGGAIFSGVISASPAGAVAIGRFGLPLPLAALVLFAAASVVIAIVSDALGAEKRASSADGGSFGDAGGDCDADGGDGGCD